MNVRHEWDDAKRVANLAKHGADFADAIGALEDADGWTVEDPDANEETRYLTIGMGFSSRLLVVVCTERSPDVIRIIPARRASRAEARRYPED